LIFVHVPQPELEKPLSVERIVTIIPVLPTLLAMMLDSVPPKPFSRSE
jgi:hypothetical protein